MNVVMKYGGTSVATTEKIRAVARYVGERRAEGANVVIVASAMGSSTDRLKEMADQIGGGASAREMDCLLATGEQQTVALLALALKSLGVDAVSLTGGQCGFITTSHHTRARIKRIESSRIKEIIASGAVPVVAGFQGIDEEGNITTLGRGGSDTTAVALAAALKWDCEIYTDVSGIYTADPRKVKGAKKLSRITYDEMMELASLGAGVLETRSVEIAKKYGVSLFLGKALERDLSRGTKIMSERMFEDMPVTGISGTGNCCTISARGSASGAWISRMLSLIAGYDISVDTIAMQLTGEDECIVSFCCGEENARELISKIGGEGLPVEIGEKCGLSRVSLVGAGMIARSGVAAKAFALLTGAGIPFYHITTSEMAISLTVAQPNRDRAMSVLAAGFDLVENTDVKGDYIA